MFGALLQFSACCCICNVPVVVVTSLATLFRLEQGLCHVPEMHQGGWEGIVYGWLEGGGVERGRGARHVVLGARNVFLQYFDNVYSISCTIAYQVCVQI